MTVADLRRLVARALTIDERLMDRRWLSEAPAEHDRAAAERRLAAWRRSGAAGDTEWLALRLAHDGIDEGSAIALLGSIELRCRRPLPEWAKTISWISPAIKRGDSPQENGDGAPQPFEELLWPAIRAADRRLARRVGGTMVDLLARPARAGLRHSLLASLSRACAPSLFSEFRLFRHLARGSPGILALPAETAGSRKVYDAFLSDLRNRWDELLDEKPVLARMIGTIVSLWLEATSEFIQRLARDLSDLNRCLAHGANLGKVTELVADLSDPHRGRRRVLILAFADRKIVYKPKDMRVDVAWAQLLQWLADNRAPISLKAPRTLVRDGYGWAEFIAADTADPAGGLPLFYRRAGGLLAILHLLQAKDLHYENVITSEGGPVIVDLETLLHPDLATALVDRPADAATRAALAQVANSVLVTYYLPIWAFRPNGRVAAMGGIDGHPPVQDDNDGFRDINTDAMTFAGTEEAAVSPVSTRLSEGGPLFGDNAAAIADGFAEMYSFLSACREKLAASEGPLARFCGLRVRAVVNATAAYSVVAKRAARPENLTDGADWSLHFDVLGRDIPRNPAASAGWRILAAERRAMANLDIPFFSAAPDAKWIEAEDGERIEDCLAEAPLKSVLRRVAQLNEQDRDLQLRLIRGALSTAEPKCRALHGGEAPVRSQVQAAAEDDAQTEREGRFIAMARRLGMALDRTAIRGEQGAAWVGAVPVDHDHSSITVVGTDLYAGTIGIALFLAALGSVADDRRSRDLAMAAIASARRIHAPSEHGVRSVHRMNLGGGMGVGSVIYGLVRIATLLSEPALLQEASRISDLLTEDRIAADRHYDSLHGAAGALLGLLVLYGATGDPVVLERATLCGRHLLAAQITDENGNKGWRTRRGSSALPTGFANGAAGIALALARLYAVTGEGSFRLAAAEAIRLERKALVLAAGHRPASHLLDVNELREFSCRWCSGVTGIGLARLGILGVLEDAELLREIDLALDVAAAEPFSAHDHLCCGNFGRIEFLFTAGRRLGRSDLVETAQQWAMHNLERAVEHEGFRLETENSLSPGFFRGLSGVGYQLLRLAAPESMPSVLLWE